MNEIEHFFSIYKDLEPGKSTDTLGFEDRAAAYARKLEACRRPTSADGANAAGRRLTTKGGPCQTNSASFPREEVQATVDRYHELRRRIDDGLEPNAFGALADFYTEDAVYIDGAWGRLEGREVIANWLVDSMVGMEDWKFPVEFTAIEGNDVVVKWTQILPRSTSPTARPTANRATHA